MMYWSEFPKVSLGGILTDSSDCIFLVSQIFCWKNVTDANSSSSSTRGFFVTKLCCSVLLAKVMLWCYGPPAKTHSWSLEILLDRIQKINCLNSTHFVFSLESWENPERSRKGREQHRATTNTIRNVISMLDYHPIRKYNGSLTYSMRFQCLGFGTRFCMF